jgi:hypothetical protein
LQQTPSVQNPEAHWFVAVHVAPPARFTMHVPPEQ